MWGSRSDRAGADPPPTLTRTSTKVAGIEQFGEQLWIVAGDRVRMLGIPFQTRMTVARLSDGGLWLHSPVAATDERVAAVEALGPIRHIVAPDKFHHLFVREWTERFPYATSWADPQLAARVDLSFDQWLSDAAEACWIRDLDQLIFAGSKVLSEVVFLHRKSRSLILTDIIQRHEPTADRWFWRTIKRLNGIVAPDGGAPRDWRLTVRDRDAARAARDRMLNWQFDRLVVTHGRCIESGAKAWVARAFAWLD